MEELGALRKTIHFTENFTFSIPIIKLARPMRKVVHRKADV